MTAIDNDIFSLFLNGNLDVFGRLMSYPRGAIALPVVVVEEVLRGRLNQIRQAQSQSEEKLLQAYEYFATTVITIQQYRILIYTAEAESLVQNWRSQGIRVGIRDMRIAAICVSQQLKLISNNKSDFHRIPNLNLETWN